MEEVTVNGVTFLIEGGDAEYRANVRDTLILLNATSATVSGMLSGLSSSYDSPIVINKYLPSGFFSGSVTTLSDHPSGAPFGISLPTRGQSWTGDTSTVTQSWESVLVHELAHFALGHIYQIDEANADTALEIELEHEAVTLANEYRDEFNLEERPLVPGEYPPAYFPEIDPEPWTTSENGQALLALINAGNADTTISALQDLLADPLFLGWFFETGSGEAFENALTISLELVGEDGDDEIDGGAGLDFLGNIIQEINADIDSVEYLIQAWQVFYPEPEDAECVEYNHDGGCQEFEEIDPPLPSWSLIPVERYGAEWNGLTWVAFHDFYNDYDSSWERVSESDLGQNFNPNAYVDFLVAVANITPASADTVEVVQNAVVDLETPDELDGPYVFVGPPPPLNPTLITFTNENDEVQAETLTVDLLLDLGDGDDVIHDGFGNDTISGGAGNDLFIAGAGADSYDGGDGSNDIVDYSASASELVIDLTDANNSTGIATGDTYVDVESIYGTDFDDVITGNGAVSHLYGGGGDDTITDGVGDNYLRGDDGADTFVLVADGDTDQIYDFEIGVDRLDLSLWGVTALDQLNFSDGPNGNLIIDFGQHELHLDGLTVADAAQFGVLDVILAEPIAGTVTGTSGADVIDGTFTDDPEGDAVTNNGDTIHAGAGDDKIYDGDGDDVVFGGDGRDTFFGGAGEDQYDGGDGNNDSLTYSLASQGVTVDLVDVSNNTGIAAGDTYTNIEAITGSAHDDMIVGDGSVFKLNGGAGDDVIVSGTRNNITTGGDGADTFVFNTGSKYDRIKDFTVGEDILDVSGWGATSLADLTLDDSSGNVIVSFGTDSVRVDGITSVSDLSEADFVFGTGVGIAPVSDGIITGTSGDDIIDGSFAGDLEGDVITDNGDTINAGAGNDTIHAGAGDDKIYDGAGDDVVFGGDGRDTFFGGAGEDQYDGGDGNNDSLTYSLASQGVTVDLVDVSNNTGIAAGDTYTNIEAITGSAHDDMIVGDGSVFKLNGGAGDDVIVSGTRNNITTGGDGADTFVFNTGSKYDRIKDFTVGEDILDVSGWGAASLADITLDDSSGNVIVSFGTDSVRVDGITSVTDLSDNDFVFV